MKELTLTSTLQIIEAKDELSIEEKELVEEAKKAVSKAYAPYSRFQVGCAVRMDNGAIVSGGNQENASFPVGLCAENTVLSTAASMHPGVGISAMAIATYTEERGYSTDPVAPCGICRQSILEFENRSGHPIILLLIGGDNHIVRSNGVKNLLPLSFSAEELPKK